MNISGEHIDMADKLTNSLTALSQRKKYSAFCTTYKQKGNILNVNSYHHPSENISLR
jgi:hypothetical protein